MILTSMRKLLIAAFLALCSSCTVYDVPAIEYTYQAPPAGAVYMSPGVWFLDVSERGHVHRRYYKYDGPSTGFRYYQHLRRR